MEYDVVIVGAGPAGLADRDPARSNWPPRRAARSTSACSRKAPKPGAHILSGAVMDPRALNELLPDWQAQGAPLNQPVTGDEVLFLSETGSQADPRLAGARLLPQPGQLRHQPRGVVTKWLGEQAEAWASRSSRALPLPRCCTTRTAPVKGVATGHLGLGKDGEPDRRLPARHGAARQVHRVRRRRARPPGQAADRAFQARRGQGPADLRHRHQGTVGNPGRAGQARPGGAHRRLAARRPDLRRRLPVSPGGQQGHARASWSAWTTRTPGCRPFEEMQRWKTHPSIRAHLEGGKRLGYGARAIAAGGLQLAAQDRVPGRRAGRLRRRLPERRAHQGQPRRDQERHAVRRGRLRGRHGRPPGRRT